MHTFFGALTDVGGQAVALALLAAFMTTPLWARPTIDAFCRWFDRRAERDLHRARAAGYLDDLPMRNVQISRRAYDQDRTA